MGHRTRERKRNLSLKLFCLLLLGCVLGSALIPRISSHAQQLSTLGQGPGCQATTTLASGDSLGSLADFYFGDRRYGPAILLATNARSADGRFPFIGGSDQLPVGTQICIPSLQEADKLRRRYKTYRRAVYEMVLPDPPLAG